MASFKEFLGGNTQPAKSASKQPAQTGGFKQFLQAQAPQAPAKTNPPSKSPFNPNTPGHDEFVKQMDQQASPTSVKGNVFSALSDLNTKAKNIISSAPKMVLDLPKTLVQPFTNPSPTEQAVEQQIVPTPTGRLQKIITAVPRVIAKGFVRSVEPTVEGLGKEVGTFLADPKNPENLPADSFQSFLHAANVGVAIGGSVKLLTEELGTKLANTNETLRVTPDELRTKLVNDEIQHPEAQALARRLITNNQTLEVSGPKPAEGVRAKVGKAIGGVEEAPNPQFRIIQNGEPVTGELNAPQTQESAPGEAITPEEPTYTPTEQAPLETPEIKTSKLALGVEQNAIANKLTEGFQDLPEYATVNVADQAKAAANLLAVNREQAINIAMGHELPPEGILPESVFIAVENHAIQTGDVALLRDLATSSSITTQATGMGQRIRMLAERDPNSAVSAIQKVAKIREEAANKKYGNIKQAKAKIKGDIQNEMKKAAPKAKDWAGFLDELKCT